MAPNPGGDRRLVLRVLARWSAQPRDLSAAALVQNILAEDADDGLVLEADGAGWRLRHVGDRLAPPTDAPATRAGVADDSLPAHALALIDEVLERGAPVSRGGMTIDGTALYRAVMIPVADAAGGIVRMVGAINGRPVAIRDGLAA